MSHGTGATDRVKLSSKAGDVVETVGASDRMQLATTDRQLAEEVRELRLVMTEVRDLLRMIVCS